MSEISAGTAEIAALAGVWFSSLGVPRTTGQIFGYLLACDPPEQTAADIAAGTGMSRGSVSAGARMLVGLNAIEERHRMGDRKTYYRMRRGWWVEVATSKMAGFERLAAEARRLRDGGRLSRVDGVDELIAFSEFWGQEIQRLRERWHETYEGTEA